MLASSIAIILTDHNIAEYRYASTIGTVDRFVSKAELFKNLFPLLGDLINVAVFKPS
jgi:hypothetical protein